MPPTNTQMGKSLNFRFRNLDHSKPIPILTKDEAPETMELISRAVPTPPTGMEKEEECEHHLQQAISAQQTFGRNTTHVIPTPEVYIVDPKHYDELYPPTYIIPKDHIRIQMPYETEAPEYDLDTDDEMWLDTAAKGLNLTSDKFEEIIQTFESFDRVIELHEAKSLLKGEDETVLLSIYDYWIEKKIKLGAKSLIPTIKTEKRDGTSGNNPYIAFRRRTEKMQTRKNRKNDEFSYQRMFKLKIDFEALSELMKMVVDREELKSKTYKKELKIRKLRYELKDYDEKILKELEKSLRKDDYLKGKEPKDDAPKKRKPRRHKNDELYFEDGVLPEYNYQNQINEVDESDNEDGEYAFKRKKGCVYLAPLETPSSWPWDPAEGGLGDIKYRYNLTKFGPPSKQIKLCYTRRRIGRGGRAIFDRITAESSLQSDEDDSTIQSYDFKLEPSIAHYNSNDFEYNYIHEYFSDESFAKDIYQQNENELFKFKSKPFPNNSDNTSSQLLSLNKQFVSKIDSNLSESILNCISNHENKNL